MALVLHSSAILIFEGRPKLKLFIIILKLIFSCVEQVSQIDNALCSPSILQEIPLRVCRI